MSWFRENRFLGTFLIVVTGCTLAALWFLLSARSAWDDAMIDFNQAAAELNRLERLAPYPSGANLRQMKAHADDYAAALTKLKDELRRRVLPPAPMAPNEFQSHLRLAMTAMADKSHAKKVRLPEKFYLGFDEFTSVLPDEAAAPLLGQELAQIEWLLETLFEAGVDALTSFRRTPLPEEHGAASPQSPPSAENQAPWPRPIRSCSSAIFLKRPLFPPLGRREKSSIRSPGQTSISSSFAFGMCETRRTRGRLVKLARIQPVWSPRFRPPRPLVLRARSHPQLLWILSLATNTSRSPRKSRLSGSHFELMKKLLVDWITVVRGVRLRRDSDLERRNARSTIVAP